MTYVLLVKRGETPASIYVESGTTPCIVPHGCGRGNKLYTHGRAFERVIGRTSKVKAELAEHVEVLWNDGDAIEHAYRRSTGDEVQIHAVIA